MLREKEDILMKKCWKVVLAMAMAAVLCVSVSAFSVKLECEDGVISGAAKEYKDGNIQEVAIASGGKIVGLGGVNDAPQMGSAVAWTVDLPVYGEYAITFAYDSDNGAEKCAVVTVDGEDNAVPIDISTLPEKYGVETQYWTLNVVLDAGNHEISVGTDDTFNRDESAGPVVKSVNADYVEVKLVKELVVPAEVVDVAEEIAAAPQTPDMGIAAAAAALIAALGYTVSKKR